jgi:hypothetical protein
MRQDMQMVQVLYPADVHHSPGLFLPISRVKNQDKYADCVRKVWLDAIRKCLQEKSCFYVFTYLM